jgi:hypothetical protein
MWSRIFFLLAVSMGAAAQTSTLNLALPGNDFVHQQFGSTCSLDSAWPPMIADLNNDGVDDIVMVARCKNPLIDQADKNYKVVDPMDSFFGYGNPAITTSFAPDDPKLRGIDLLVIHGSGPEAWRSATPLAKFVIINLPVKTLTLKRMKVRRKRIVNAIYVEEASADEMTSAIFWDGKKYRYQPLGSATE